MAQAKRPAAEKKWSREDLRDNPDKRTSVVRKGWRANRDDPGEKFLTVAEFFAEDRIAIMRDTMAENRRVGIEKRKREQAEYAEYADLLKAAARLGIVSAPSIDKLSDLADALATTLTTEMLSGDLKPRNATEAVKVLTVVNEVRKGLAKGDEKPKAEDTDDAAASVKDRLAKLRVVKDQTA